MIEIENKGLYGAFEGIVGCGKTTQSKLLHDRLRDLYPEREVIWTREPGGSEIADAIRKVVQGTEFAEDMDPVCEQYLYAASRAHTLRKVVKPVLDRGGIVVADRSVFTSVSFQGFGRGLGPELVLKINEAAVDGLLPDRVLFINTGIDMCLGRKGDLAGDKFEAMGHEFFSKAIEGYLYAVATFSIVKEIDGNGTIAEVQEKVWEVVASDLGLAKP